MICPDCHGRGFVRIRKALVLEGVRGTMQMNMLHMYKVCTECGGCGLQHCCDGLQEQPEKNN